MVFYVIIGAFGAFGALCALWILLGAYLTDAFGGKLVLHLAPGKIPAALHRYRWLRELGLIRGKLVIVTTSPPKTQPPDAEIMTLGQYVAQLEQEQKKENGI